MRGKFELAVLAALVALPAQALADASPQSAGATSCLRHYPGSALTAGIEGKTTLAFTVTGQGTVSDVSVAKSSGNADLDNAAAACVAQWRYKPATQDAKPVAVPWQATVEWKLH